MTTTGPTAPTPFTAAQVARPNALARLLGRGDQDVALQALANLFAARDPSRVTPDEVRRALAAHGVRGAAIEAIAERLFRTALTAFLADETLDAGEWAYLEQLRRALDIRKSRAESLAYELAMPRFEAAVTQALSDGRLTEAERESLGALAERLKLSASSAQTTVARFVQPMVERALNERIRDGRYSPADEQAVTALATALGVGRLTMDLPTERALAQMRLAWEIENGQLPVVDVRIALQRDETCHYALNCRWAEHRTRTVQVNYSGISSSIQIVKGVRFRVGSIRPQRITATELTVLDAGCAYLTNKRVIFDGTHQNKAVRWSALIGARVFSDGLVLEKATGKPPHLLFEGLDGHEVGVLGLLTSELLARA